LLPHVAGTIAYRAVRNRGTIGGSLAHGDPAADWVSIFPLLDAEVTVSSRRGKRTIPAADLLVSSFTTVLAQDELIETVRVPKLSDRARWGVYKINQKAGEFAHAIAGVLHDPERGHFRAVIGAIETAPIVVADATVLFSGPPGPDLAGRVNQKVVERMLDERAVRDAYTRQLALTALKRAARQACGS
jgi:carbon-monoxide dehydrogenase medium subunit